MKQRNEKQIKPIFSLLIWPSLPLCNRLPYPGMPVPVVPGCLTPTGETLRHDLVVGDSRRHLAPPHAQAALEEVLADPAVAVAAAPPDLLDQGQQDDVVGVDEGGRAVDEGQGQRDVVAE